MFCFTKIFRNSHREIFDLDGLLDKGYEVILLDLTSLHGGNPTCTDQLMLELRVTCENKVDLNRFVDSNKEESIIYVTNDVYLTRAYSSFKSLIKAKDRLLGFRTKTIPCQHNPPRGLKGAFTKKIQYSNLDVSFFKSLYLNKHKYFAPDYYLCNTVYNLPLKANLTVKKDNILIVHSDDVNKILENDEEYKTNKKSAVFIDQLVPFAHKSKVSKKYFTEYYEKIEDHLNRIKSAFHLDEINIAQHPESLVYKDELKNAYKSFPKKSGETLKQIKKADFVISHYSTALGFAVYLGKPILLLTDKTMEGLDRVNSCSKAFRNILGLKQLNMDNNPNYENLNINVNTNKYREYIKKYMKDSEISENSYHYAVDIIAEELND